jgi:hypothetical protein
MMLLLFTFNSHAPAQNIALTDRFEIVDIMNSYARALDTKDYSLLRSIFAIDVEVMIVFDSDSPDGGLVKLTGRSDWIEYVEAALDGTKASQHLLGNPMITLDGNEAVVRTDLQATEYYKDSNKPKTTVWGVYETHMVKDKSWKITRHTLTSIGSE